MQKALRRLFKKQKNQSPNADGYLHILEKDINLELKQKIFALEGLGEVVAKKLQHKYTDAFGSQANVTLASKFVET